MRTFDFRAALLAAGVALSCLAHCGRGDDCVRHSDCGDGLTCVEGHCTAPGPAEPVIVPPSVNDASPPGADAAAVVDAAAVDASELDAGDAGDASATGDAGDGNDASEPMDASDAGDAQDPADASDAG